MSTISTTLSKALKTLITVVLGAAGLLLLAFGPRATDQFPKDCVIVEYWEKWAGTDEPGGRQIVNDFNNTVGREKHIYVRYLATSDVDKKTLVACAAGEPPDIAGLYNQNIPQYAAVDALEPLDDLAVAHGITADSYKKVFWDECHYEGHLYGLVSTAFDLALFYNKSVFQQHAGALRARGLDPNRAPRTIAELDAYAQALDQFDASGHIEATGFLPTEPGWYLNYASLWFGGSWWDEQHHKFTFTDPAVVRTYRWVQSYPKRLGAAQVAEFHSGLANLDSPQNPFLIGTLAMEQQGMFLANFIRNLKPSMAGEWGAAPFPSFDPALKDVTYCNCDVLVIPRGAKHRQEAFEFMAFFNRQDEMEKIANMHGKLSPLAKVSDDFFSHHSNPYIRVFDSLAGSPNARPTALVPILPEVNEEMQIFFQRLALLQVTPEEGLQQMQQDLQRKYDDFEEEQREHHASS